MNWILFEEITDYMENHLTQISITGLSEEFHFQEDYKPKMNEELWHIFQKYSVALILENTLECLFVLNFLKHQVFWLLQLSMEKSNL